MSLHDLWPGAPLPSIDAVRPGDTLLLHGGRYGGPLVFPYRGTAREPITITNAPGEYVEVGDPAKPPGEKTPLLVWLARGSAHQILAENPAGGELLLRHNPPGRTSADLALGFRVTGDHCEVRNVRATGAVLNTSDRRRGGAIRGIVCWRWGVDSDVRGSGYAVYAQSGDSGEQLVIGDCLLGLGHSTAIHVFGSQNAARNVRIERCAAIGSGAISQREAMKAAIVIDEEDPSGLCDGVEIRDCVIGNPYHYGGAAGGLGGSSIQLGSIAGRPPNGAIAVTDCDLFGVPNIAEQWAWVRATGNTIFHRPGQTGVENGFARAENMLRSRLDNTIITAPGYPEPFPAGLAPRIHVWENPFETGRAHIVVAAFHGERSVHVDLTGITTRGKRYQLTEIMRGETAHFTAGVGAVHELELPDVSPRGVAPGRDPHPVAFEFLLRAA